MTLYLPIRPIPPAPMADAPEHDWSGDRCWCGDRHRGETWEDRVDASVPPMSSVGVIRTWRYRRPAGDHHHPKEDTVPDTADQSLTAAQLTERIRAASTLDELTALRGVLVDHDGPIVAGEFFEAAKLYGERRKTLEGVRARREVADATAGERLEAELASLRLVEQLARGPRRRPRLRRPHDIVSAAGPNPAIGARP